MTLDILPAALSAYAEAHTSPESDLLRRLNRDTNANVLRPNMLSGHLQGRMLALFSHLLRPRRILEIGTYTGYSALCLAEGLTDDGKLITLDINEELEKRVRHWFAQSDLAAKIDYRIGNAADIIPTLDETFDLVFIDADKAGYAQYFDLTVDRVRPGGLLIADNVLWKGKVTQPELKDKALHTMMAFNQKVHDDPRVENVLFPVRDGLMVMRKLA
ncbi:Predicted O-methyltransferase YrrM [Catalinimonas alkaloidigena]|uniref:Predicted O-methyltransferase YrrM n=1 Tax=Catalinimonas alkaloidigena TaxID=1075417 RepID=A0A1G9JB90_9BACT|nr:O-methyltransferase [Catalinimonas alkaloidigena]SDL34849.1 Predicted O-methyltransferase YrrM [Catalinimonas alkaloidigena]